MESDGVANYHADSYGDGLNKARWTFLRDGYSMVWAHGPTDRRLY